MNRPNTAASLAVISCHTLRTDTQLVDLDEQLTKFWELESIGIEVNSQNCDPVHKKFLEELTFNEDRCRVKLPWKSSYLVLPIMLTIMN